MKLWEIIQNMGEDSKTAVSFVGAGGKTGCILELAQEWARQNHRVLVTTTTHMENPTHFPGCSMINKSTEEILSKIREERLVIAVNRSGNPVKTREISEESLIQLQKEADKILIEADGSKRYPVKVPGEWEPVIFSGTTHIVILAGASALGKELEKVCHRLEEAEKLLGCNQEKAGNKIKLTEEVLGELLEKGYVQKLKEEFPGKKLAVLLNQADLLPNPEETRKKLESYVSVPVFLHGWNKSIHFVFLAAGFSRRFGENKLLYKLEGKPMYRHLLDRLITLHQEKRSQSLAVVTQYDEILKELSEEKITVVKNQDSSRGVASSLKLGLEKIMETQEKGRENFYMFFAADQPYLSKETIGEFLSAFLKTGKGIGCVCKNGSSGNPVIFHEKYVPELMALEGDKGGKRILNKHLEDTFFYEVRNEKELRDIDFKEEIETYCQV